MKPPGTGATALIFAAILSAPVLPSLSVARNPGYACAVDVINKVKLPDSDPVVTVDGYVSLFPVGLVCTFQTESGRLITEGPGVMSTAFLLAAVALVVIASALTVRDIMRQDAGGAPHRTRR